MSSWSEIWREKNGTDAQHVVLYDPETRELLPGQELTAETALVLPDNGKRKHSNDEGTDT